ncbi:heavy-metal-associated domain-containing protein [Curtobacterium sp. SP.BCp]|uniref:heavy-metal-associated domain-containing protein n=1 Tax=Curtobacterium sp. SP.BCp TaxID=3435230 RepID=UPI003F73D85A
MTTQTLLVTGMTCEHCVMSVTEELSEVDGVQGVEVDLVPGGSSTVTVTSDAPVDDDVLRSAVAEAGYEVVRS